MVEATTVSRVTRTAPVQVYSYDSTTGKDTLVIPPNGSQQGVLSADPTADTAFRHAKEVVEYYSRSFGRNSYDNKGSVVTLRIHAPGIFGEVPANICFWLQDEKRIWLGDGDGDAFATGGMGDAKDVVAHEFTHAVIDSEVKLDDTNAEQMSLHESISDVLATGIDGNWTIAEKIRTPKIPGDALRDMANPTYTNMKTLPAWVVLPHEIADVPNHAAYLVAQKIGAEAMRKLWYSALTDHLKNNSSLSGLRKATVAAAKEVFGADSEKFNAVKDAWSAVGIEDATPARYVTEGEKVTRSSMALGNRIAMALRSR